jgi:hypothetical protein
MLNKSSKVEPSKYARKRCRIPMEGSFLPLHIADK